MGGHGDATVAGPFTLPLSQPNATPASARLTADGTGSELESDPSAEGVIPPEVQL